MKHAPHHAAADDQVDQDEDREYLGARHLWTYGATTGDRDLSLRSRLQKNSKSHDVVAAIYVDGFSRNPGAEVGCQEQRRVANFSGFDVSF